MATGQGPPLEALLRDIWNPLFMNWKGIATPLNKTKMGWGGGMYNKRGVCELSRLLGVNALEGGANINVLHL